MSPDIFFLSGAIAGVVLGGLVGYLLGLRDGDRRSRPSWNENQERERTAWHEGVAFGKHLEKCKKELGL